MSVTQQEVHSLDMRQEIKQQYNLTDNTIEYMLKIFNEVSILYRLNSLQDMLKRPISDSDVMNYIYRETVRLHDEKCDEIESKNQITKTNDEIYKQEVKSEIGENKDLKEIDEDEEKLNSILTKVEKGFKLCFIYGALLLVVGFVSTILSVNLKYSMSITILSTVLYKFFYILSCNTYKSEPVSRDKYKGHKEGDINGVR